MWEPLTPRGVAAFAHAPFVRLWVVQIIVALLVAIAIVWFLAVGCFPTIHAAIQSLPAAGEIHSGKLGGQSETPKLLAEGRFLAFDIDLDHSRQIHSTADVQIEFGRKTFRIHSLLGYLEFPYVPDRIAPFNRTELEPLWGAWSAEILFLAGIITVISLMFLWAVFATIYFVPAWTLGFFTNRDLNFRASWKLSGAILMPGALLVAAAVALYGFGVLDLASILFIYGAHLVLGWIYLFAGMLFVPRISLTVPKGNPFVPRN